MNARRFLELQERQALAGLRRTAPLLARDLAEASLVAQTARRHPLATVAGAAVLGLLAGALARPLGRGARTGMGLLAPIAGMGARMALRQALRQRR